MNILDSWSLPSSSRFKPPWFSISGLPRSNQDQIPCVFPVISLCSKVFPVFFSIKITFIPLISQKNILLIIPQTKITIASFHFPVYQVPKFTTKFKEHWYITPQSWNIFNFLNFKIFPVLEVNPLCKNKFLIFFDKFPVFSLSGKMNIQIPSFPCAVATLYIYYDQTWWAIFMYAMYFLEF